MSYATIALIAQDADLRPRLTAAAAAERKSDAPSWWVEQRAWQLAATPGWAAAYASAIAAQKARPGSDEAVITDSMILAAVQPMP